MNFDNYKFRASAIGSVMTNDRSGKQMGETAKKYLLEVYIKEKYGRDKELINKYLTKGLMVEEDSFTLYSRAKKTPFFKNKERLENEFITGTPDIITDEVIDIKSSWSIHTFFAVLTEKINKMYEYQLQSYMALTGLQSSRLAYCLVSTPEPLILDEIKKLQWKMGVSDPDTNEAFRQAADYLETSMRYDDIPFNERYIEFIVDRDDEKIEAIYQRVKECRDFLNQLDAARM